MDARTLTVTVSLFMGLVWVIGMGDVTKFQPSNPHMDAFEVDTGWLELVGCPLRAAAVNCQVSAGVQAKTKHSYIRDTQLVWNWH